MTTPAFIDETVALFERTPTVVRALVDGLPDSWLSEPDTSGGWTARAVVGHLITGEHPANRSVP